MLKKQTFPTLGGKGGNVSEKVGKQAWAEQSQAQYLL